MKFTEAIVRPPCQAMVDGLTSADLGRPEFAKAMAQHETYLNALSECGLNVTILEPDNNFPDSTFVEDIALLAQGFALITRPGAPSRRGETESVEVALQQQFECVERIEPPGTVDAGDIMMVGKHFYIGLSERTNSDGAEQTAAHLARYGMSATTLAIDDVLHLKSGVSYLEHNTFVATDDFIDRPEFADFKRIRIDHDEAYAANCLWINETVLVASGFPKTIELIRANGYRTVELDMSEFRKLDGGLSCLSLRF